MENKQASGVTKHLPELRGSRGRSPRQPRGGAAGVGRNTQRTISVTRDDNRRREAQEA